MAASSANENKRRGELYCVCSLCNRISYNLASCDHCDAALSSEQNVCNSGDPKRPRLNTTTSVNVTDREEQRNNNSATCTIVNSNTDEKTGTSDVRPAGLFVNVNNPAPSVKAAASSTNPTPTTSTVNPPPPPNPAGNNADSSTTAGPPPSPQQPSDTTTFTSANPRVLQSSINPQHTTTADPTTSTTHNNRHFVAIDPDRVIIPAQQIRIGSRKFKPSTPVTFKDDGIQFALEGYIDSPVLLNARAITKCKANLNLKEFPLFMLQLESSCMRQITHLFKLLGDEVNKTSCQPYDMKSFITVIPTIENSGRFTPAQITAALEKVFNKMQLRYKRCNMILEKLTPEKTIDLLLAPRTQQHPIQQPQQPIQPPPQQPLRQPQPPTCPFQLPVLPNLQYHGNLPFVPPRQMLPCPTYPVETGAIPQGLIVPTDPHQWQQMMKDLQVGAVYHVQMHNGLPSHCLWNGTNFLPCDPCLVQNTEVTLECTSVRIGSMRAQCTTSVTIKLDNNPGFFFTVTSASLKSPVNVHVDLEDIQQAYTCFENMNRIYLYLEWSGGQRVRNLLNMNDLKEIKDPNYDPNANEEYRKHFIFTLNNVNHEQKLALAEMGLFRTMPIHRALQTLAGVQKNSSVKGTLDRWVAGIEHLNPARTQQLIKQVEFEFAQDENLLAENQDDDDIVMTEEEIEIKCPYTQMVMMEPMRNKVCGHNYEKTAIEQFIKRKKKKAKCPYDGCGNRTPMKKEDLELNPNLKAHIQRQQQK